MELISIDDYSIVDICELFKQKMLHLLYSTDERMNTIIKNNLR